jgi:hypothetical protein
MKRIITALPVTPAQTSLAFGNLKSDEITSAIFDYF